MKQYTKAYIQLLLNKFMDGTTTLDEEDVLHDYFTHGKVPAEWALYEQLFAEIESMYACLPTEVAVEALEHCCGSCICYDCARLNTVVA